MDAAFTDHTHDVMGNCLRLLGEQRIPVPTALTGRLDVETTLRAHFVPPFEDAAGRVHWDGMFLNSPPGVTEYEQVQTGVCYAIARMMDCVEKKTPLYYSPMSMLPRACTGTALK